MNFDSKEREQKTKQLVECIRSDINWIWQDRRGEKVYSDLRARGVIEAIRDMLIKYDKEIGNKTALGNKLPLNKQFAVNIDWGEAPPRDPISKEHWRYNE